MTYTDEEQKQIEDAAKEYSKSLLNDNFSAAFYSSAMQQIIESRIKAAKIEENESMLKMAERHMDSRAIIVLKDRINELKKCFQKNIKNG